MKIKEKTLRINLVYYHFLLRHTIKDNFSYNTFSNTRDLSIYSSGIRSSALPIKSHNKNIIPIKFLHIYHILNIDKKCKIKPVMTNKKLSEKLNLLETKIFNTDDKNEIIQKLLNHIILEGKEVI